MSEQALNLQSDWEEIKTKFTQSLDSENLQVNQDRIKYDNGVKHLEIHRNGLVIGEMPLHSNQMESAEGISLNGSEIIILSENSEYRFEI